MNSQKISNLPAAASLEDEDTMVLVQGGKTKRISGLISFLKIKLGINELNGNFQYTDAATFIKNDHTIYFINHANTAFAPIQCANVVIDTGNLATVIDKLNFAVPTKNSTLFDADIPANANFLLYKYTDTNWCGIGADSSGRLVIRFGMDAANRISYVFAADGIYLNGRKITT